MRWTNDVYVSTPHRVGTPVQDRYSLGFFLDPNPDARVEVLAKCLAPGTLAKYPAISGADYLREAGSESRGLSNGTKDSSP
jgi:isopenicillin N synthase-like dioxygenase